MLSVDVPVACDRVEDAKSFSVHGEVTFETFLWRARECLQDAAAASEIVPQRVLRLGCPAASAAVGLSRGDCRG